MTIIELGDPGSSPPRSAPRGRHWRHYADTPHVAIAQAVLCFVVIGGSAHPGPALDAPVWSIPFSPSSGVAVAAGTVFTLSTGDADSNGPRVTAYGLGNGVIRWSAPMPTQGPRGGPVAQEPGTVMVPVQLDDGAPATETLDVRTGSLLWWLTGDVIDATPETVLLGGEHAPLRQVRMADGGTIWSRPAGGAVSWAVAGRGQPSARVVAAGADGRVTVLHLADGAPMRQARLPDGRDLPVPGGLSTQDGIVYINLTETDRAMVVAYDLDTLALRWRFAQASSFVLPTRPAANACGIVICFRDGTSTLGLDPGNGTVRWRAGGWIDVVPTSDRRRLLADSPDHASHALIDSRDGRVVADLGAGTPVWDYRHAEPVYYLRAVDPAGSGFEVSRIHLRTGELEPRGLLSHVGYPGCTADNDTVICGTTSGKLSITDVD
ncbi:outer membrane protein assembly factor BamB family protein [Paractinoplanes globisporus]|uniref:PQQ-binding-like beta-propeller repeat protein n=1 Tax=Paractinoplanes globisporus TaxID=113565 RepID=A0ABW6WEY5_9ACTN|nr:PQQ-binding-like beta-propeller repeat protein [Actinoplanes globisporus]